MTRPITLALALLLWSCAAQAQAQPVVAEDQPFRLSAPTVIWYGAGAKFVTKALTAGTHQCSNRVFGDPSPGVVKQCRSTAFEQDVQCYPAQLGGTGSRAAWGVSLSPVQAWAGWWCAGRMQVVACTGSGCKPDLARLVMGSTDHVMSTVLAQARTEHIDSAALRAVWEPHLAEIVAARP